MPHPYCYWNVYVQNPNRREGEPIFGPPRGLVYARSGSEALELARDLFPSPAVAPKRLSDARLPRCLDPL